MEDVEGFGCVVADCVFVWRFVEVSANPSRMHVKFPFAHPRETSLLFVYTRL